VTRTAVAAVAAALLLPLGGGALGAAPAAAAECVWHRHTKRVVKRVKRHGKVRRVVRKSHRWTCDPVASAPVASPSPSPATGEPAPPEEPVANRVSVKSAEYLFILSRPSVNAGAVTVELNNYGEDPHNLHLKRQGGGAEPELEIAETGPQQRTVAQFALAAGTYRLWCSLPEHDELGMHATLEVAAG